MLLELSEKLRSIFRKNTRSDESDTAGTAAKLADKVLALVETMPPLPDTAMRAVELANDPDCRMPQFARLIEGDPAIATGILRVANSAFYAGGMPAMKLQQAVVRLGVRPCQSLIVAIGMRTLFRRLSSCRTRPMRDALASRLRNGFDEPANQSELSPGLRRGGVFRGSAARPGSYPVAAGRSALF